MTEPAPELSSAAIKAMIDNAKRLGLIWTMRPATVMEADSLFTIMVQLDGDTAPVSAYTLIGAVGARERVMCVLIPPGGVFIIGTLPTGNRANSYQYLTTVYYDTAGVDGFDPADYPGGRAARVKVVGGGGAGGGSQAAAASQHAEGAGGGGGGYAEAFISFTGLVAQIVTVGAGGTGVTAGTGNAGGTSSFGSLVVATGGAGGTHSVSSAASFAVAGGSGGIGTAGDLLVQGGSGTNGAGWATNFSMGGTGGSSVLGGGGSGRATASNGQTLPGLAGGIHGGGGGGGVTTSGSGGAGSIGGAGGIGIVIVEVYV